MSCFVCPFTGVKQCDGSCGLGCSDCPGLSFDERVDAAQILINEGKASSEINLLIGQVIDRMTDGHR